MAHKDLDTKVVADFIRQSVPNKDHVLRLATIAIEVAKQTERIAYGTACALAHPECPDKNTDQINDIMAEADWHRALAKELSKDGELI